MIKGHGDDAYLAPDIVIHSNFSSNIAPPQQSAVERLNAYLSTLFSTHHSPLASYPEPEAWSLERMIAERHGINAACVIVTAGVTDAIYLVAQTFRHTPLMAQPTFSEYEDASRLFQPADTHSYCYWLCNPNNPTGTVRDALTVERLSVRYDLVVVDQSYEHYTRQQLMSPREAMVLSKVVQLHSMSKTYGVPGLRLGYITAPLHIAQQLRRNMRPWAVSALAIEAGKFLLEHDEEMRCRPHLDEAQRLQQLLRATGCIDVMPTSTNFMLCKIKSPLTLHPPLSTLHPSPSTLHPSPSTAITTAAQLKDYLLRQHGMLIRDASNFRGLTPQHFRVAAQSPAENDALVQAISEPPKIFA